MVRPNHWLSSARKLAGTFAVMASEVTGCPRPLSASFHQGGPHQPSTTRQPGSDGPSCSKTLDQALFRKHHLHVNAGFGGEGFEQRFNQLWLAVAVDIHDAISMGCGGKGQGQVREGQGQSGG